MIVYVASPFHGDGSAEAQRENMKRAAVYCAWVAQRGHVPYAPHLMFPLFLDENKPGERDIALKCGIEMLKRCDHLIAFTDHGISEGMKTEIEFALSIGKPVQFATLEGGAA